MTATDCIAALDLPTGALVDQRVPKKALSEPGASIAAARRTIQEGIESLRWVAAIKPATSGVPAHTDGVREYVELVVLHLHLRPAGKEAQLLPLIHRAIPYPLLLVSSDEEHIALSLAKQPRNMLYELYQGWLDTVLALQTACVLGNFTLPRSREHANARSAALLECAKLESEMASLRAAAAREKQLPRQVELNLQLKRLGDAHAAARARL